MRPTTTIPAAESDALLREIERQATDESRAIVDAAEREARAIVARSHATARQRMHDALEEFRHEGIQRLARAKAQLETEARQRAQQRADENIRRAWPMLVEALTALWRDRAARRSWTDCTARQARDRLRAGIWTVEHPPDWSAEEQEHFRAALGADGKSEITFTVDPKVAAGLRIRAEQAMLDATPQGLMADGPAIAALLLAEIEREGS